MAIATDELLASFKLNQLSVCNCKKHCANNRCKCVKNNLPYTNTSKWCENDSSNKNELDEDDCYAEFDYYHEEEHMFV